MTTSNAAPQFSTEEVCRTYYETQIFGPAAIEFFDASRRRIQALAPSLKVADRDIFFTEVAAANIELFGLAWLQHLEEYGPGVPNSALIEEISFTKNSLQSTGRADIWEAMHAYNDALAETILLPSQWPDMARLRDVARMITDDELQEEHIKLAGHLAESLHKITTDRECVSRLVVRLLAKPSDAPQGDLPKVTAWSQALSLALVNRMGVELGPSGLFGHQTMIVGLYENAVGFLGSIRDYGTYEAGKSARSALIDQMIGHVTRKKPGDSN